MKLYKAKEQYVVRRFADEIVLVPVGEQIAVNNSLIVLNETSHFIWTIIQTAKSIPQIVEEFMEEYDITEDVFMNDLNKFIDMMEKYNAVEITEN